MAENGHRPRKRVQTTMVKPLFGQYVRFFICLLFFFSYIHNMAGKWSAMVQTTVFHRRLTNVYVSFYFFHFFLDTDELIHSYIGLTFEIWRTKTKMSPNL